MPLTGKAVVIRDRRRLTDDATPRRAYSAELHRRRAAAKAAPEEMLGAAAARCTNRMERIHNGNVKAERWTFADGRRIIEVSLGKRERQRRSTRDFRSRIVAPLLERGVRPLPDSKTELGSACWPVLMRT